MRLKQHIYHGYQGFITRNGIDHRTVLCIYCTIAAFFSALVLCFRCFRYAVNRFYTVYRNAAAGSHISCCRLRLVFCRIISSWYWCIISVIKNHFICGSGLYHAVMFQRCGSLCLFQFIQIFFQLNLFQFLCLQIKLRHLKLELRKCHIIGKKRCSFLYCIARRNINLINLIFFIQRDGLCHL